MTQTSRHLFVYGTLRKGFDHPMACFLAERADHLGGARAPGLLYDLGRYPGMLDPAEPGDWVYGDLFALHDPAATLDALDRYEGCPLPGEPALFERGLVAVTRDTGEAVTAWVYRYAGPVSEGQRLASGDYREVCS